MERVGSTAEFLADPIGRYYAAERVLVWCASPDLLGAAAWGEPLPDDIDLLAPVWDAMVAASAVPFDKVFDIRHVTRVADDTFARLVDRARSRIPIARTVKRQLLLAPPGITGAITHGFWQLVPSRHPWRVMADDQEGFSWLGRSAAICAEVSAVVDEARDAGPLGRLQAWLEDHLAGAELAAAAGALGVSPRTLQRVLGEAKTSFRREVQQARLRAARRLLAEEDAKVEAVAAAVGCSSASSFVRLFREQHGETPAAYRDRIARCRIALPRSTLSR